MKKSNYFFISAIFLLLCFTILMIILPNRVKIRDKIIIVLDPSRPVIALTFDDGPNKRFTPDVLDLLYENKCQATFFINGRNIPGNEDLIKKIVGEGHELSNHTYDHYNLVELRNEEIKEQLERTQKELNQVLDHYSLMYVRPPYGSFDARVLQTIDYPVALWSLDSMDWKLNNSHKIYEEVVNNVKDGDVIILHDKTDFTVGALKEILPTLKERGFQFVTLTELYRYRSENLQAHKIYR